MDQNFNIFKSQQTTLTTGTVHKDLLRLLVLSIEQGKFVTACKILTKDTTLISEYYSVGNTSKSIVRLALENQMDSLVIFALNNGLSPDDKIFGINTDNESTLLEYAISVGSPVLVDYAIAYGAQVTKEPKAACSTTRLPLSSQYIEDAIFNMTSISNADLLPKYVRIVQSLIDAGASTGSCRPLSALPSLIKSPEIFNEHSSKLNELIIECIKKGADVDATISGMPLISIAFGAKNLDAVLLLLQFGADTSKEKFDGKDILEIASINGFSDQVPQISEAMMKNVISKEKRMADTNKSEQVVESIPRSKKSSFDVM